MAAPDNHLAEIDATKNKFALVRMAIKHKSDASNRQVLMQPHSTRSRAVRQADCRTLPWDGH